MFNEKTNVKDFQKKKRVNLFKMYYSQNMLLSANCHTKKASLIRVWRSQLATSTAKKGTILTNK